MTRGAPGRTRVIKTLTRGAPGHDPGHDAISKTSKNVIFEVCDAFKEEPSGQKTQITQVDPPPLPPQQIGLQSQNREIFWEHDKKVPRVMTRVIWVMMPRVMPRVHASDPGRPGSGS